MVFETWFKKGKQNENPHKKVADANLGRVLAAGLAAAVSNAEPAHGVEAIQTVAPITHTVSFEKGPAATREAVAAVHKLSGISVEEGERAVDAFIQTHPSHFEDFIYDPAQDLYDAILSNKSHGLSEELVRYIKDQIQEVNE